MNEIHKESSARCCWCSGRLVQLKSDVGFWFCLTPECFRKQLSYGISRQLTEWTKIDGENIPKTRYERLHIPTPKQVKFSSCKAKKRLFGGAAGGGKSVEGRRGMYKKALMYPGYEGLILRESFPELERTHLRRMAEEVHWFGDGAEFIESKRIMKFSNGSLIECGHMDDERALQKYLSTEYDEIMADEGSRFDPMRLLELSTRARSSKPKILEAGGPWFDVVSNPGGRASQMLKDLFILKEVDPERYPVLAGNDADGVPFYDPNDWEYIPATLDDNPYLDPAYVKALAVLQPWRYQQLRNGDWDVAAGAFFTSWSNAKHMREVDLGDHEAKRQATWFRSLDWGYHDPCVVAWWVALPDGHYHCMAELKLKEHTPDEVKREVQAMDRTLGLPTPVSATRTYADPATRQRGGQTGETILETFAKCGMPMIPSVNERQNGWMRVTSLLRDAPDGIPYMTFASECRYLRRSIAAAVSKEKELEDVEEIDDHGLDCVRYFAMSRPMPNSPEAYKRPAPGTAGHLLDQAIAEAVW